MEPAFNCKVAVQHMYVTDKNDAKTVALPKQIFQVGPLINGTDA
jgi:hypothetical protein